MESVVFEKKILEIIPTIVTILAIPANIVVFSLLGNRSLFEYFDISNNQ